MSISAIGVSAHAVYQPQATQAKPTEARERAGAADHDGDSDDRAAATANGSRSGRVNLFA